MIGMGLAMKSTLRLGGKCKSISHHPKFVKGKWLEWIHAWLLKAFWFEAAYPTGDTARKSGYMEEPMTDTDRPPTSPAFRFIPAGRSLRQTGRPRSMANIVSS